jgi:hypothetical protein
MLFFLLSLTKIFLLELIFSNRSRKHMIWYCVTSKNFMLLNRIQYSIDYLNRQLSEPSVIRKPIIRMSIIWKSTTRTANYPNVNYPNRQISEPQLSETSIIRTSIIRTSTIRTFNYPKVNYPNNQLSEPPIIRTSTIRTDNFPNHRR